MIAKRGDVIQLPSCAVLVTGTIKAWSFKIPKGVNLDNLIGSEAQVQRRPRTMGHVSPVSTNPQGPSPLSGLDQALRASKTHAAFGGFARTKIPRTCWKLDKIWKPKSQKVKPHNSQNSPQNHLSLGYEFQYGTASDAVGGHEPHQNDVRMPLRKKSGPRICLCAQSSR